MYAQTFLILSLLAGAPPIELTGPRLEKGLEVRWKGQFTEASFVPGVRTVRAYDVDTLMLVVGVDENGSDVALFTRIFLKPNAGERAVARSGAVRMELARVDKNGLALSVPSPADPDNPSPKAKPWASVQLQGLPYHEVGMFVDIPTGKATVGSSWILEENKRPAINWKASDFESFRGHACMKVVGKQMTSGFANPVVTQVEWRRQDTLTIQPSLGFASRIERVIERREPDIEDLAFRSVLKLELENRNFYSGRLFEERREEALSAAAHTAMLDRLLADAGRGGAKSFESLVRRIDGYLTDHPGGDSVPYREAITAVRKRAFSASKGNIPPAQISGDEGGSNVNVESSGPLVIGKPVPDISPEMLTADAMTKLSKLKGRPVLLAYVQQSSQAAAPAMKTIQSLAIRHRGKSAVMPLLIGDVAEWKKLYDAENLSIPLYDGNPVYKTHGLDATPVFIIVDGDGIVRQVIKGWGTDTAETLNKEFERWVK